MGYPTHIINLGQSPTRDIVSDSQNMIYLVTTTNYSQLRQIPYTPGSGFGTFGTFGNLPSGWDIRRITVDPDDNPVILSYYTSNPTQKKVYHWNGTDWDDTDLPASFANLDIQDFDFNPAFDHYVFVTYEGGLTNMYAIDTDGDLKFTELDVFSFNHIYSWWSGIYIDQADPGCHFAVWGGYGSGSTARPVILFDATYSELSHGNGGVYSGRGTRGRRGAWAPGTNRLVVGGCTSNVFINHYFNLPPEW